MALKLEGVGYGVGRATLLCDVTAQLTEGEVTVVLGPNGAGKSTLMQLAAGLLRPGAGRVLLDGTDVAAMPPGLRARAIGYLPQEAGAAWNLSARELVTLGRHPWRAPMAAVSATDRAAMADAIAATRIEDFLDRPIATLSGGERARVLLARAWAGQPRWLLADEPLANLDPAHALDLAERLRTLAAGGTGVVLVLHDLALASIVADRVLLLADGRMVVEGAADAVLTPRNLRALFGIEVARADPAQGRAIWVPVARSLGQTSR